ncbi:MAG TPA: DUF4396 domain-containing protein [Candidatus Binataceae bacterium]|nr:DUF4396 domain-containing protein [Candidatus Binataceae bacterium]
MIAPLDFIASEDDMLDGVILTWFILTALSVAFVAIDIRSTPESPVLKWGFVLVTLFTGAVGAMLYVLGCREPLPGTHEQYVAAPWRQTLGSTMHCVAGDGIGILAGAVLGGFLMMPPALDIATEYILGFGFGLGIFQALFMRDMVGGSYTKALAASFIPELTSMNCLMAGMIPVAMIFKSRVPGSASPGSAAFWLIMSMALLAGFIAAYPMNWWLVANKLKHGMLTVRPVSVSGEHEKMAAMQGMQHGAHQMSEMEEHSMPAVPGSTIAMVVVLSFAIMAAGIAIAIVFMQGTAQ